MGKQEGRENRLDEREVVKTCSMIHSHKHENVLNRGTLISARKEMVKSQQCDEVSV